MITFLAYWEFKLLWFGKMKSPRLALLTFWPINGKLLACLKSDDPD